MPVCLTRRRRPGASTSGNGRAAPELLSGIGSALGGAQNHIRATLGTGKRVRRSIPSETCGCGDILHGGGGFGKWRIPLLADDRLECGPIPKLDVGALREIAGFLAEGSGGHDVSADRSMC